MSFSDIVYTLFGIFGGGIGLGFYMGHAVGSGRFKGKRKKK